MSNGLKPLSLITIPTVDCNFHGLKPAPRPRNDRTARDVRGSPGAGRSPRATSYCTTLLLDTEHPREHGTAIRDKDEKVLKIEKIPGRQLPKQPHL